MVKRQTVWLSTMMVLSLMLIGYYTMNNNGTQTAGSGTQGNGTSTETVSPSVLDNTTGGTGSTGATTGAGMTTGTTSVDDFFVIQQTNAMNQIAREEQTYLDVLANNSSTATQIDQAEQQLQKLQGMQGSIQSVAETIKSDGYNNCAIVPSADGSIVTVYVKARSLTALNAAKLMNLVSQQLSMPIDNVRVQQH